MRYIKFLFLVLVFVISMLFFVQNTQSLSQPLSLILDLKFQTFKSIELPLYTVILLSFALGGVLATVFFMFDKIRMAAQLHSCKSRMNGLEKELNSLRNAPLEQKGYSASEGVGEA